MWAFMRMGSWAQALLCLWADEPLSWGVNRAATAVCNGICERENMLRMRALSADSYLTQACKVMINMKQTCMMSAWEQRRAWDLYMPTSAGCDMLPVHDLGIYMQKTIRWWLYATIKCFWILQFTPFKCHLLSRLLLTPEDLANVVWVWLCVH